MNTLDQILEIVSQSPDDQQEVLIRILQNRRRESRRAEIAIDAQHTLADFRAGHLQPQSAEEIIATLRQSLNDSEDEIAGSNIKI